MAAKPPTALELDMTEVPPPPPPPVLTEADLAAGWAALKQLFGGKLPKLPVQPIFPLRRGFNLQPFIKMMAKVAKAADPKVTAALLQHAGPMWAGREEAGVLATEVVRAGDAASLALLAQHGVCLHFSLQAEPGQVDPEQYIQAPGALAVALGDAECAAVIAAVRGFQRTSTTSFLAGLKQMQEEPGLAPISYRTPDRVRQFELALRLAVHDLALGGRLREVFHDSARREQRRVSLLLACAQMADMGSEKLLRLLLGVDAQLGLQPGTSALAQAAWGHPHFASHVGVGGNVACMQLLVEGLHARIPTSQDSFCHWLWSSPHTCATFSRVAAVFPPFWILFVGSLPFICVSYRRETKCPLDAAREHHHAAMVAYLESLRAAECK